MKEEKIKIISNADKLPIDCILMKPEGEIKGVIQIAHGMNEHKERYIDFMNFLAENGYASFINDHRGHGKSIKKKEDIGYFYEKDAEIVIEDLYQITLYLREQFVDKKIILFGHSMGSMIVRKYIAKYDNKIDGLIVCGSPSKNVNAKLGLAIVKILEFFKGENYRSKFVKNLMFSGYNKDNDLPNSWICNNKETVEKYNADELCQYNYTLNGFENIIKLMIDIYNPKIYEKNNLQIPIYFIAGANDPVIASIEKWYKAQQFLKELGYANISSDLYENMSHEILNELENKTVYVDILNWINNLY